MDQAAKPEKSEELSPFERFREFARRIIAVPRSEIDELEKQYRRERAEEKRKRLRPRKGGANL